MKASSAPIREMKRALAAWILVCGMSAAPCFAADSVGGSLGLTSDYVFRGLTQSNGQPAIQGGVHYASTHGWLAGLWGSTVQLNWWEGRTGEIDAFVGYRWPISVDWSTKLTAVHYAYPWNSINYDYDELIGSASFRDMIFATVAWTFNASHYTQDPSLRHRDALSYEVAAAIPLPVALVANLGVGRYELQSPSNPGYTYWNAGLGYDWRAWHAEVSYVGTTGDARQIVSRTYTGNRVSATLLWRF